MRHDLLPALAEDRKWIGRNARHLVVRAVHDEFHATGKGTKLANDQTIADERIVIEDVALKVLGVIRVVVVGVVTDDDVRVGHCS